MGHLIVEIIANTTGPFRQGLRVLSPPDRTMGVILPSYSYQPLNTISDIIFLLQKLVPLLIFFPLDFTRKITCFHLSVCQLEIKNVGWNFWLSMILRIGKQKS